MKTLRQQIGGFFDYGGTFSSLQNGQMLAMAGIGDWITGTLERNGAKVKSVIPEEGGLQFTESFSIGKGSQKADLARKWIQYITSPKGQVKSANMAAYPCLIPNRKGWELLATETPEEAGGRACCSTRATPWTLSAADASNIANCPCSRASRTGTTSGPNTRARNQSSGGPPVDSSRAGAFAPPSPAIPARLPADRADH